MIPENYQEFCIAVVKLAREYKVQNITATIHPEFNNPDNCKDDIRFQWSQGRHGDKGTLHMETAQHVYAEL